MVLESGLFLDPLRGEGRLHCFIGSPESLSKTVSARRLDSKTQSCTRQGEKTRGVMEAVGLGALGAIRGNSRVSEQLLRR